MNLKKRTFEEVRESLRGKVILVVNRGIPARRICRSIGERFEAVSAMTVTDVEQDATCGRFRSGIDSSGF